jgi:hypothetical protein
MNLVSQLGNWAADAFASPFSALLQGWQSVGSSYSWGFALFLTGILTLLFPMSYLPNFITWSGLAIVSVLQPVLTSSQYATAYNFFQGNDITSACIIMAWCVGYFVSWTLFYWLCTSVFWFWIACMNVKFVLWLYHQFWGSN